MKDAVLPGSTGRLVTGGYFQVLGVDAGVGSVFTEDDDRPSAPPVAVISHNFWKRAFGGRAEALGKTIQIGQAVVTIVGVAPPQFFGERVGSAPDMWLPMNLAPWVWVNLLSSPAYGLLTVMARFLRGRGPARTVNAVLVTGGYFPVLGIAARLGRVFTEADDRAAAPPVAVINDSF